MQYNPAVWFEIYVDDLARAKQFYESVLATQLEPLNSSNDTGIEMLMFPSSMEHYGAAGAIAKMEGCPAGANSSVVYFGCEDCAVEESRVAAAGGQVQRPKMSIGEHGFIALAVDSEGNLFGLHSAS